jgi:hypothetical protein
MKLTKLLLPAAGLLLTGFTVQADVAKGKMLVEQACSGCHDTSVYSRPDKKMKSLSAIQAQVERCPKPAGMQWSEQDSKDVVEYLNKEYYHYE